MSEKVRKNYNLKKETVEKIHQVMEERNMNETSALEFIVNEYFNRADYIDAIIDRLLERDKSYRERLRWATRTAEINSQMLLDAMNTILVSKKFEYCCFPEAYMSPVLEQSKENIDRKIEHYKQEKDNRERKNHL